MRILHVIPQFPYFGGDAVIGGHAGPLLTLAREQVARGSEVTILSYLEGQASEREIQPGIMLVSLFPHARTSTAGFGLKFLLRATEWSKKNGHLFDLAHVHSGFLDYVAVSGGVRRAAALPTVHSLYCPIPIGFGRVNYPIARRLLRRIAEGLDCLTAISDNTAASIDDYGIRSTVEVVPPALDLTRFAPGPSSEGRGQLGMDDDELVVLFVGNAKPQKNLSGVLKAFSLLLKEFPRARLVITTELAAASPDARLKALRAEMQELRIESRVTQFGIIDNMPELIRSCDLLVAPFLDSFGPSDYFMAVLEAMATGKPTVVSDVGGMAEVIKPSVGRLVQPEDFRAIAKAMMELAADRELRQRLGAAARELCEARFSSSGVAASFAALYSRVC